MYDYISVYYYVVEEKEYSRFHLFATHFGEDTFSNQHSAIFTKNLQDKNKLVLHE